MELLRSVIHLRCVINAITKTMVSVTSLSFILNELRMEQNPEVMRRDGLRNSAGLGNLADTQSSLLQNTDHSQPMRITEGLEFLGSSDLFVGQNE